MKIKVGDLISLRINTPLGIGEKMAPNEQFEIGDLLLTIDDNKRISYLGDKTAHYHFISAKTGSSIYWPCSDLESEFHYFFNKVQI
jgi:hypothetical protein